MPIVIQRNRASGLNDLGQGMTGAVQNWLQGGRELARQQAAGNRGMMQMGMLANQVNKDARKEASKQAIEQAISTINPRTREGQDQLLKLSVQAPELVNPILTHVRQEQQFEENKNLQRQSMNLQAAAREDARRRWEAEQNKPKYDPKLGGFVTYGKPFEPLQMPEGYTPPAAQVDLSESYTIPELRKARGTKDAVEILDQTLGLYEDAVKKHGWTPLGTLNPSGEQELNSLQRDFQMQLKELYNLGVLNGPDLMLMNEIMPSATEIGDPRTWYGKKERIIEGVEQARGIMNRYKAQTDRILKSGGASQAAPQKNVLKFDSQGNMVK